MKGADAMVTYGNLFTFVIMLCAVITLVIAIYRQEKISCQVILHIFAPRRI